MSGVAAPNLEEAREALARSSTRLGEGLSRFWVGFLLLIEVSLVISLSRRIDSYGWGPMWRDGAIGSELIDIVGVLAFAVAGWFVAPRLIAFAYEPLLERGRLVTGKVVAGPDRLAERFGAPLGGLSRALENLLASLLPTRIVNYSVEGGPISVGALYADETLDCERTCWLLVVDADAPRRSWVFRRPG